MARYEAKQNFSNPLIDRRFSIGEVYDLDPEAEEALAGAIERGRLARLPDDPSTEPAPPAERDADA